MKKELRCPIDLRRKMTLPGVGVAIDADLEEILMGAVRIESYQPKIMVCGRIGIKPVLIEGIIDEKGLVGSMTMPRDRVGFFIPNPETSEMIRRVSDESMWTFDSCVARINSPEDRKELTDSWNPTLGPLVMAADLIEQGKRLIFYKGRANLDFADNLGVKPGKLYRNIMDFMVESVAWRMRIPVRKVAEMPKLMLDAVTYERV